MFSNFELDHIVLKRSVYSLFSLPFKDNSINPPKRSFYKYPSKKKHKEQNQVFLTSFLFSFPDLNQIMITDNFKRCFHFCTIKLFELL